MGRDSYVEGACFPLIDCEGWVLDGSVARAGLFLLSSIYEFAHTGACRRTCPILGSCYISAGLSLCCFAFLDLFILSTTLQSIHSFKHLSANATGRFLSFCSTFCFSNANVNPVQSNNPSYSSTYSQDAVHSARSPCSRPWRQRSQPAQAVGQRHQQPLGSVVQQQGGLFFR